MSRPRLSFQAELGFSSPDGPSTTRTNTSSTTQFYVGWYGGQRTAARRRQTPCGWPATKGELRAGRNRAPCASRAPFAGEALLAHRDRPHHQHPQCAGPGPAAPTTVDVAGDCRLGAGRLCPGHPRWRPRWTSRPIARPTRRHRPHLARPRAQAAHGLRRPDRHGLRKITARASVSKLPIKVANLQGEEAFVTLGGRSMRASLQLTPASATPPDPRPTTSSASGGWASRWRDDLRGRLLETPRRRPWPHPGSAATPADIGGPRLIVPTRHRRAVPAGR